MQTGAFVWCVILMFYVENFHLLFGMQIELPSCYWHFQLNTMISNLAMSPKSEAELHRKIGIAKRIYFDIFLFLRFQVTKSLEFYIIPISLSFQERNGQPESFRMNSCAFFCLLSFVISSAASFQASLPSHLSCKLRHLVFDFQASPPLHRWILNAQKRESPFHDPPPSELPAVWIPGCTRTAFPFERSEGDVANPEAHVMSRERQQMSKRARKRASEMDIRYKHLRIHIISIHL